MSIWFRLKKDRKTIKVLCAWNIERQLKDRKTEIESCLQNRGSCIGVSLPEKRWLALAGKGWAWLARKGAGLARNGVSLAGKCMGCWDLFGKWMGFRTEMCEQSSVCSTHDLPAIASATHTTLKCDTTGVLERQNYSVAIWCYWLLCLLFRKGGRFKSNYWKVDHQFLYVWFISLKINFEVVSCVLQALLIVYCLFFRHFFMPWIFISI